MHVYKFKIFYINLNSFNFFNIWHIYILKAKKTKKNLIFIKPLVTLRPYVNVYNIFKSI